MLLARRAPELKKRGVDLNETSVRAMQAMVSERRPEPRSARKGGSVPDRRAAENEIQRCLLLLSHLLEHGDPDALEANLLPELLRVAGELRKRQTRREAVRE